MALKTLQAVAGTSMRAQVVYLSASGAPKDTTGYTAHLYIRGENNPRLLLKVSEGDSSGILTLFGPGVWNIFLGKTFVSQLPPTSVWEIELHNNTNSEDVIKLTSGVILTEPNIAK